MPTPLNLIYRVCAQCSKTFGVWPCKVRKSGGVFCSRACHFLNRVEKSVPPEIRFWNYVNKTEGCWLWTGACASRGYGHLVIKKPRYTTAHRLSWEIHNGPIPKGLWVLHHCDTPACVRPDHLFLGTRADNEHDRTMKGRGNARFVQAFGEVKPLCVWAKDPRCLVKRKTFNKRLDRGVPPEEAMTSLFEVPKRRTKSGEYLSRPLPKKDTVRKSPCKHEPQYPEQQFCRCKLCGCRVRYGWRNGVRKWVM